MRSELLSLLRLLAGPQILARLSLWRQSHSLGCRWCDWALMREVVILFGRRGLLARVIHWAEELLLLWEVIELHEVFTDLILRYLRVNKLHGEDVLSEANLVFTVEPGVGLNDFSETLSLIGIKGKHLSQESFKAWRNSPLRIHITGKVAVLEEHFLYLGIRAAQVGQ